MRVHPAAGEDDIGSLHQVQSHGAFSTVPSLANRLPFTRCSIVQGPANRAQTLPGYATSVKAATPVYALG